MRKHSLRILFVVLAICPATSAVQAQWLGAANPRQPRRGFPPVQRGVGIQDGMNLPPHAFVPQPPLPVFPDREKRRDDREPSHWPHILGHGFPHAVPSHNGPTSARGANPHTPRVVPPEMRIPPSDFRFTPASEFHYVPRKFTPVMGEGASTIARGFAFGKGGGIFAGIGGGIAAFFGAIFGRKKDS